MGDFYFVAKRMCEDLHLSMTGMYRIVVDPDQSWGRQCELTGAEVGVMIHDMYFMPGTVLEHGKKRLQVVAKQKLIRVAPAHYQELHSLVEVSSG
jgi:hypothetical protein